jgi:NAD+ synthase (glutamine-hydrolysing)
MCGGFSPIKDCLKQLVYDLANWRNSRSPAIPQGIIDRPPSAELRPDQRDDDSLPPYEILDRDHHRLRRARPADRRHRRCRNRREPTVRRVAGMVLAAEYKRRQGAPGPRITRKAFGRDRRYPDHLRLARQRHRRRLSLLRSQRSLANRLLQKKQKGLLAQWRRGMV